MTKIVAEICDNRKIHGKIMASTVQSKHVPETLFYTIYLWDRKTNNINVTSWSQNHLMHVDC